ncbi:IclR family transcriptional regulator [Burkholderia sp. LMU1-1-1.1]|uniref:IclR family transcriptional regulator n=1 Tax=Burkholderia sp. LMU1-1-1.1 TaxID=3135266 RepID=UPI00342178C1
MSSLTRMLSILGLFSKEHTALSADAIADELQLARTTCYRYIKELMQAGLLVSNMGLYGLGPRIIQLDYQIRETDPLLNIGRGVLAELVASTGGIGLLATIYDSQIINIHQEGDNRDWAITYSRGKAVPTFRSASSKVILAHLKQPRLKRLWKTRQHEADVRAIGPDWESFKAHMQAIKEHGYWISHGELDAGSDGVAAPILYRDGTVAGSLTLVFNHERYCLYNEEFLGKLVMDAATRVGALLPGNLEEPRPAPL